MTRMKLFFFITIAMAATPSLWALPPSVSTAYGGGYYHYENASPAYRHGVKTPFNSFPQLPKLPTVTAPTPPVVPIPTMADLGPNPENAPQPYIGAAGLGYYSDDVMDEYDPSHYRNPNPNHHSIRGHLTENPQEPTLAGNESSSYGDNGENSGEETFGTDKPIRTHVSQNAHRPLNSPKKRSLAKRDHYKRYSAREKNADTEENE